MSRLAEGICTVALGEYADKRKARFAGQGYNPITGEYDG